MGSELHNTRSVVSKGRAGRRGAGLLLAAALLLPALVSTGGCASYALMREPMYGEAWESFAAQAGSAAGSPSPHVTDAPPFTDPSWGRAFEKVPWAQKAVRKVEEVLRARSPSRSEVEGAMADLKEIEREVRASARRDPAFEAKLRAQIAEMRRRMEEKLLEIARIEPAFDITSRGKVRVAVVKIGDGVETIRTEERIRWKAFLTRAGFAPDTVFIPAFLTGEEADAASLRVAGARLGADAVVAYTTFAATTASPFGESAAVLSFAKCMVVDTRTEYLYLNAEGECRLRRVSLPFTVCSLCLEEECLGEAVGALRGEILHELKRLSETESGEGE